MTDSLTKGTDTMTGPALGGGEGTTAQGGSPAKLASIAAEAVRALNHATLDPDGGYEYAGDVYDVLGDLRDVADYLSQAVTQAARWLSQADAAGCLSDVDDRSARGTRRTIAEAASMLASAARYAAVAGSDLATAQCVVGRLATDDSAPVPYLPADTARCTMKPPAVPVPTWVQTVTRADQRCECTGACGTAHGPFTVAGPEEAAALGRTDAQ